MFKLFVMWRIVCRFSTTAPSYFIPKTISTGQNQESTAVNRQATESYIHSDPVKLHQLEGIYFYWTQRIIRTVCLRIATVLVYCAVVSSISGGFYVVFTFLVLNGTHSWHLCRACTLIQFQLVVNIARQNINTLVNKIWEYSPPKIHNCTSVLSEYYIFIVSTSIISFNKTMCRHKFGLQIYICKVNEVIQ